MSEQTTTTPEQAQAIEAFVEEIGRQQTLQDYFRVLDNSRELVGPALLERLWGIAIGLKNRGNTVAAVNVSALGIRVADLAKDDYYRAAFLLEVYDADRQAVGKTRAASGDKAAQEQGEKFYQILLSAKDLVPALLASRTDRAFRLVNNIYQALMDREAEQGHLDRVTETLDEARRLFNNAGSRVGEVWQEINLSRACIQSSNPGGAFQYAVVGARKWEEAKQEAAKQAGGEQAEDNPKMENGEETASDFPLPSVTDISETFEQIADVYYYKTQEYEKAVQAAEQALRVNPESWKGQFVQGNALLRLGQFEKAAIVWAEAVQTNPEQPGAHLNLGIALTHLGRFEEAVQALDKAVALRPKTPKYHFCRAEALQGQGRHEEALSGYATVITLAEEKEKAPGKDPEDAGEMPPAATIGYARIYRIRSLEALGRTQEALAECDALIGSDLPDFRWVGYQVQGDILEQKGDLEGAIASCTEAIRVFPNATSPALMRRADLYLKCGDIENALTDLRSAIYQDRERPDYPERMDRIIARLTDLLKEHPGHAGIWKTRGLAYLDNWYAGRALQDFTRTLEITPDDAEALCKRGLAHLHFDSETVARENRDGNVNKAAHTAETPGGESLLNDGRPFTHFTAALEDLGNACRLDPQMQEARVAYRWLADRGLGDEQIESFLTLFGGRPTGLFTVFPKMQEAVIGFNRGLHAGREGKLAEAIEDYTEAQTIARRNGFAIFALRLGLHLADCCLRQYALQKALDHLDTVQAGLTSAWAPLAENLQSLGTDIRAKTWQQSGHQAFVFEPDYHPFYLFSFFNIQNLHEVFLFQTYARLGNAGEAKKHLMPTDEYFLKLRETEEQKQEIRSGEGQTPQAAAPDSPTSAERLTWGLSVQPMLGLVMALRDMREYDRAFEIMRRLEPLAGEDYADSYASTMSSLYAVTGQIEEEAKWRAKLDALPEGQYAVVAALNRAETMRREGRAEEALATLTALESQEPGWPLRQRERFWMTKFYSLWERERWEAAFQACQNAFALDEQIREDLTDIDARAAWHGQQEMLYEHAIVVGVMAGQIGAVYSLVERSRARAFLDQLAFAPLPLPPETTEIESIRERVRKQQGLLQKLTDQLAARGPDYLDLATLRAVEASGFTPIPATARLLEEENGIPRRVNPHNLAEGMRGVQNALADLDNRIEAAHIRYHASVAGEPLSLPELRALLQATASPPRNILLAEYFTLENATLLFVMRADYEAPELILIEKGREELRAFAAEHFQRARRFDAETFNAFFAPFVTPLWQPWADGVPRTAPDDLVWIVPHDALHYIPLHAVQVDGETLLDHHPVSYTPSASILPYCLRNAEQNQSQQERSHSAANETRNETQGDNQNTKQAYRSALIIGDTVSEAPLPHARLEALAVQHLFAPNAAILLGEQAARSEVLRRLTGDVADADVLHFACHGRFDPEQPMQSGLLLAAEEAGTAQETLTAEAIFALRLHPKIVTLSACESGVSARRPGDELIGLIRAFLYAGTPSLLVSLWQVDDSATGLLMQEFYRALKNHIGKADALRQAQRAVRDMPIQEVISRYEQERALLTEGGKARLARQVETEIAWLFFAARDFAAARSAFQALLHTAENAKEKEALELAIWKCNAARFGLPVDYARCLYAHPWYWAAFSLIGDWQ